MSSGGLHGDPWLIWHVIFILASLLFIYHILLILSRLSHYKSSRYQSKSFGRPPFLGLILIGNWWETGVGEKRGTQEERAEQHREEADKETDKQTQTDIQMTTSYIKYEEPLLKPDKQQIMCTPVLSVPFPSLTWVQLQPGMHNTSFRQRPGGECVRECIWKDKVKGHPVTKGQRGSPVLWYDGGWHRDEPD